MFKINKKLEYGLEALLYLAASGTRAVSTREMAAHCKVPEAMLSKILQILKSRSLVQAVHGNRGGYRLSRPLDQIPLGELVAALETPSRRKSPTAPSQPLRRLGEKLGNFLAATSLGSLREQTEGGSA